MVNIAALQQNMMIFWVLWWFLGASWRCTMPYMTLLSIQRCWGRCLLQITGRFQKLTSSWNLKTWWRGSRGWRLRCKGTTVREIHGAWVLQRTVVSKGCSGWASIGAKKLVWSISRTWVLAVTPEWTAVFLEKVPSVRDLWWSRIGLWTRVG